MKPYPVPSHETQAEILVSNSRFIATLAPVFSVEKAREFIEMIRDRYSDATHNVPVYVIGHGSSVTAHSSDDGEPSGTAGRPALAVLQGSGLGDTAVVITRYFGGTKLGTGGLVRAYSDAVRAVLEVTPRSRKVNTHFTRFSIPYPLYETIAQLVNHFSGQVTERDFSVEVTLTCQFPAEKFSDFQQAVQEFSRGEILPEITRKNQIALMPEDLSPFKE